MPLQVDLERLSLGEGPTPVRELTHLGDERGLAPVWIKDDGAYSRFGGNKARKLEWLLADAQRRGKRTILTGGALGTNHGLAMRAVRPPARDADRARAGASTRDGARSPAARADARQPAPSSI